MNETATALLNKIQNRSALVGIIGLGYVGLPLALCFTERGYKVLGFDIDTEKVNKLNAGENYIKHLDPNRLQEAVGLKDCDGQLKTDARDACDGQLKTKNSKLKTNVSDGCDGQLKTKNSKLKTNKTPLFQATTDFTRLSECDAILICVPTPLGPHKEPDLSYVEDSTKQIRNTLRKGQLIVLESTTYPGTTDELLRNILESAMGQVNESTSAPQSSITCDEKLKTKNLKLKTNEQPRLGETYFLAFSPEREDPGNPSFGTKNIPKVVGGVDELSGNLAEALYAEVLDATVRVKNARTAEASKLVENIFRAVNIALVNELKMIFEKMDVDIWDVLDAAETKPFGFMRFNPGPGLGGHCLRGDQVVHVRGMGLDGQVTLQDLYRTVRRDCEGVVTAQGMFLQTPGLETLSFSTDTGEVCWAPVGCLYRGRYDGAGVSVTTEDGVSLAVTAEHPMVVEDESSFRVVPAHAVTPRAGLLAAEKGMGGEWVTARPGGTARVAAVEGIDVSGVVYSLEVTGTSTFATNAGVVVHNCIPLDPFYLAWKAREAGQPTRFIELAGEINTQMPAYVVDKLAQALNEQGKAVKGAKVLVLGLAYKPDIDDPRESPAFEVINLLLERGAEVSYHDPHIPIAPKMRTWPNLPTMESSPISEDMLSAMDVAVVVTNHNQVDYEAVLKNVPLVIDTRGVYRNQNGKIRRA